MRYLQEACYHCAWTLACLALAGCGGGGERLTTVKGKVLSGGRPVVIPDYEEGGSCLQVEFFSLDESGKPAQNKPTYGSLVKEDGSFTVTDAEGKGVPAGKYRVAVRRLGETPEGRGDVWGGTFDADKSPFHVEIPSPGEVVIDLAQASAGKSGKR